MGRAFDNPMVRDALRWRFRLVASASPGIVCILLRDQSGDVEVDAAPPSIVSERVGGRDHHGAGVASAHPRRMSSRVTEAGASTQRSSAPRRSVDIARGTTVPGCSKVL